MPLPSVPLPSAPPGTTSAAVLAGVDTWIRSTATRRLVAAFGGRWPDADTTRLLSWLDDFSAAHWDFRQGRERPAAPEPALSPAIRQAVVEAARALGLMDAVPPPNRCYRHLIVLGGLANACLLRTGYAGRLLHAGTVTVGEIGVLGSFRELSTAECEVLDAVGASGCAFEVDALDVGVRHAFGVDTPTEVAGVRDDDPHRSWSTRTYRPTGGPPVVLLAAPSSAPGVRRAHTADTQRFWAQQVRLSPGDRVLVVTAPIYVPFQHCDAVRTLGLPYGCGIDTIGVDPAYVDDRLPQPTLTPGRYLQEIRSAIRSMRALHASVTS